MSLEIGIVGLAQIGKTALFTALTGVKPDSAGYSAVKPNVGVVPVPDDRLALINQFIPTDKIVPATIKVTDIAGLVKGASTGEGLGNKFLAHIREVDAVMHVVRCFTDPSLPHAEGSVDPIRDIETVETELIIADLESLESSLERVRKMAKHEKEAAVRLALSEQCIATLNTGKPLRTLSITDPDQKKMLKGLGLITAKKVLYVANVDESDLEGKGDFAQKVQAYAAAQGCAYAPICCKLEAELGELSPADRKDMLASLGLKETALAHLCREAYRMLGLQSYFTAGQMEIKAWTIPIGATAPQAAGVIHTDFEKGFIRAEVYSVDDLAKYKTENAIRAAGKLRVEGKSYVFQDGDVTHFLFNV